MIESSHDQRPRGWKWHQTGLWYCMLPRPMRSPQSFRRTWENHTYITHPRVHNIVWTPHIRCHGCNCTCFSTPWEPWKSFRICPFADSKGKQEWLHKGPKFFTTSGRCNKPCTLALMLRSPTQWEKLKSPYVYTKQYTLPYSGENMKQ